MSGTTAETLKTSQEQAVISFCRTAQEAVMSQFSIRSALEDIDRSYMREKDYTSEQWKARIANMNGDSLKLQNVVMPVVMPQVEAALGYLINVFLTGYPIFGVVGDPLTSDAAEMIEAVVAENSVTSGWARQLLMFFRDGLKYNFHGIECTWEQRTVYNIETDVTRPNSAKPKSVLWHGNVLKRMDPYNTFFDPRVHPADIHSQAEFVGYNEILGRTAFKSYMNDLTNTIHTSLITRALESQNASAGNLVTTNNPYGFYVPSINPFPILDRNMVRNLDWMAWAQGLDYSRSINMSYSNSYIRTTLYARIIPSDFGLSVPERNTPQVWKFVIINGQVVILAERQTNVHNFIPVFFGQPMEDGLDLQTKSFASNVMPMQDVASALWNGFIASKRRLVTDRVLYDPLRIRAADINSDNPSAKIPVRNSAYGKNVSEAVYAFPFRDDQANSLLTGAELINKMANLINGQNPAAQGQFVKGNKTLREYEDTMGHGNSRNQAMALTTESQVFVPLKEVFKLNILQYQADGAVTMPYTGKQVMISQKTLRETAVQFKISDGILPAEKLMNGDEFMTALQVIGSSPQIGAAYNVSQLFTYLMKQRGADLKPFEKTPEQMQYDQALAAWSQAAQLSIEKGVEFKQPQPQPPPPSPAQQGQLSPAAVGRQSTQGASGVSTQQQQDPRMQASAQAPATSGGPQQATSGPQQQQAPGNAPTQASGRQAPGAAPQR